jgi:hypothetical protein
MLLVKIVFVFKVFSWSTELVNLLVQSKLTVMKQQELVLIVQMNAQNVFHPQVVRLVLTDTEFLPWVTVLVFVYSVLCLQPLFSV